MTTYFVAETTSSLEYASKAIVIEAKNLTGAKIKATKLWAGNPEKSYNNTTMLMLGDHIDASGHIDHVLATKNGRYYGTAPCWFYDPTWIEREDVAEAPEEAPEAPELHIGDTVKVIGDNAKRFTNLVGLTGFIYDEFEDEAGTYFVVEFNKPVGGCLQWDFMPQDLAPISVNKVHQDALTQAFLNAVEDAFKHTYKPANSKEAEAVRKAFEHALDDIQIEVQSNLTTFVSNAVSLTLDRAVRKVVSENKA